MKVFIGILILVCLCFSQDLLDKNYFSTINVDSFLVEIQKEVDSILSEEITRLSTVDAILIKKNYHERIKNLKHINNIDRYICLCLCGLIDVDDLISLLEGDESLKEIKNIRSKH
jgi:acyl carrier protein phosphodiesterase